MLRARVSISRKVSRDPDSTGYGVTLEGEVPHPADDAEAVLERVGELFSLAEEALAVEIERDQAPDHRRTSQPQPPVPPTADTRPHVPGRSEPPTRDPRCGDSLGRPPAPSPTPASPRQVRYLLDLGRRKGLTDDDLDAAIREIAGSPKHPGELTRREAGLVIDRLTRPEQEDAR